MPSNATLLIVVTDWTTGTLEGAELLRHRHQPGRPDPDRLPDGDVTDTGGRQRRPSRARSSPRAPRCHCSRAPTSRARSIAASFSHTGGGEIHHAAFDGEIQCVTGDQADADADPDADADADPDADADRRPRRRPPRRRRPRRPTPTPTPTPAPTPTPTPTPSPRRPRPRRPTPTSTPDPEPTPTVSAPDPRPADDPVAPRRRVTGRGPRRHRLAVKPRARITGLAGCVKTTKTVKVTGTQHPLGRLHPRRQEAEDGRRPPAAGSPRPR